MVRLQKRSLRIVTTPLFIGLSGSGGSSLILDDFRDFVSDELSAFVRTSSLTGETHGLLLFNGVASLEHFHHLALERRESGDLSHDFTDSGDTGMDASLGVGLSLLESIWVSLGLCHDVTLVQTNKNS